MCKSALFAHLLATAFPVREQKHRYLLTKRDSGSTREQTMPVSLTRCVGWCLSWYHLGRFGRFFVKGGAGIDTTMDTCCRNSFWGIIMACVPRNGPEAMLNDFGGGVWGGEAGTPYPSTHLLPLKQLPSLKQPSFSLLRNGFIDNALGDGLCAKLNKDPRSTADRSASCVAGWEDGRVGDTRKKGDGLRRSPLWNGFVGIRSAA